MSGRNRRTPKMGKWDHAVSPLQQARHDHRWHQHDACQVIQRVCPGHSGKPCRLQPSKLSDWENRKKPPSLTHVQALCEVYQRSAEDLGLITWRKSKKDEVRGGRDGRDPSIEETPTNTAYAGPDPEPHPEVEDAMRRSTFVKGAAAISGAFLTDPIAAVTRRVQEHLSATMVSNREVETLAQAALRHARGYHDLAAPGRAEALMTDWATAAQLMQTTKTQTQARELSETFARISGVFGSYVYDQGDGRRALLLFRAGLDAAVESGNNDLAAWLCQRQTLLYFHNINFDEDPRVALDLVERGLDISGSARTPIVARLHARAAKGYAAMGDGRAVDENLGAAADIIAAPSLGCWPSDVTHGFTYVPELHDGDSAYCYMRLGEYRKAKAAAERVLSVQIKYTDSRARSSVLPANRLNLATCHLNLSEPVEACYVATVAVQQYTGVAEQMVLHQARTFQRDLVAAYPELKVTREFTEFLRSRQPEPSS